MIRARAEALVLTAARGASDDDARRTLFQFQRSLCAALAPDTTVVPPICEHVLLEASTPNRRAKPLRYRVESGGLKASRRDEPEELGLFDAPFEQPEGDWSFEDGEPSVALDALGPRIILPSQLSAHLTKVVLRAKELPRLPSHIVIEGAAALTASDVVFLGVLAAKRERSGGSLEVSIPNVASRLDATRLANPLEAYADAIGAGVGTVPSHREVTATRARSGSFSSAFAQARATTSLVADALERGFSAFDCVVLVPERSPRATLFALAREFRRAKIPHAIAADREPYLARALDACTDRPRNAGAWSDLLPSPFVDAAFAGTPEFSRPERRALAARLRSARGFPMGTSAGIAGWSTWNAAERTTLEFLAAWLVKGAERVETIEACDRFVEYLGENEWVSELRSNAAHLTLPHPLSLQELVHAVARFAIETRPLPSGAENDVRIVHLGRNTDVPRGRVVIVVDADRAALDEADDAWLSIERGLGLDIEASRSSTLEHARRLVQVFDACEDEVELAFLRTSTSRNGEPTEASIATTIASCEPALIDERVTTTLVPTDWARARAAVSRTREDFFRDPKRTPSALSATLTASARERAVLNACTGGADHALSVTALERLASCAFRGYAYGVLRIRDTTLQGGFGPREEGMLTHEALHLAFTSVSKELASRARDRETILRLAAQALDERMDAPPSPLVQLELTRAKRVALQQLDLFLTEERYDLEGAEVSFGAPKGGWPALEISDDAETLRLRGTIDRVDRDRNTSHARIIDYKRSLSTVLSAPRELGSSVFQAPIYAIAAKLSLRVESVTGAYIAFSVRAPEELESQSAGLADALATMLADVPRSSGGGRVRLGESGASTPLPLIGSLSLGIVKRVRDGKLAPIPRDESTCTTCAARSVCRKPRFVLPYDAAPEGSEASR